MIGICRMEGLVILHFTTCVQYRIKYIAYIEACIYLSIDISLFAETFHITTSFDSRLQAGSIEIMEKYRNA